MRGSLINTSCLQIRGEFKHDCHCPLQGTGLRGPCNVLLYRCQDRPGWKRLEKKIVPSDNYVIVNGLGLLVEGLQGIGE